MRCNANTSNSGWHGASASGPLRLLRRLRPLRTALVLAALLVPLALLPASAQPAQAARLAANPPPCVARIAAHYGVELRLVQAIMRVEGGWVGLRSRNRNGSYDLGPMQINTIWLPQLRAKGISEHDLVYDFCANVAVGTWILARELERADAAPGTPEFWQAVGRYHSRTPQHNVRYAVRVWYKLKRAQLQASALPSSRQGSN